jgi:hypothetical protein
LAVSLGELWPPFGKCFSERGDEVPLKSKGTGGRSHNRPPGPNPAPIAACFGSSDTPITPIFLLGSILFKDGRNLTPDENGVVKEYYMRKIYVHKSYFGPTPHKRV